MQSIGKTIWCLTGGHIPLRSTGREPENTSRETICFLNAGQRDATVALWLFYEDREPVGPYSLTIPARRSRQVRVNDLIDPEAVPLDTDYALLIESDHAIVVGFNRLDSSSGTAITNNMAVYEQG